MSTATTTTQARLLEAQALVSQAVEIIDEIGPQLDEPERGALVGVLGSRHDLARIVRQLGNLAVCVGHEGGGR